MYQNVGFIHLMKLVAACFGRESKPPTTCEKYHNAILRTSDHISATAGLGMLEILKWSSERSEILKWSKQTERK